ncbi:MAG: hypothetical protein Q4D99_01485 [Bacillota bacterium]|nr:hypothetical protein [Bacillota bacterium]
MSTSIENLRRLAERDVKDHTALFDLYVTVGRDIDYLAIKFGIDPEDLINLLEGYGEKLRVTAADVEENPALATAIMEDRATAKAIEEFGVALDYSGRGRYKKLSRLLIEEYIERFYPGIASEKPENDWICLEAYLDRFHPGWKGQLGTDEKPEAGENAVEGKVKPKKTGKRKVRNTFKLY